MFDPLLFDKIQTAYRKNGLFLRRQGGVLTQFSLSHLPIIPTTLRTQAHSQFSEQILSSSFFKQYSGHESVPCSLSLNIGPS